MHGGAAPLADERTRLAEVLQDAGYFTVGIHANSFLSRKRGYGKGFERFRDYEDAGKRLLRWGVRIRARLRKIPSLDLAFRALAYRMAARKEETLYWSAETQNDFLLKDLETRDADRPFFAWIHYMDAHVPYLPTRAGMQAVGARPISDWRTAILNAKAIVSSKRMRRRDAERLIDLYDAVTWDLDREIGALLDALEARGDLENTTILVTADHGDEFGEHGVFSHDTEPFPKRGCRLTSGLLNVPLVIIPPEGSSTNHVESQVTLTDIPPTIAALAGIVSAPSDWQGRSLVPATHGQDLDDVPCFAEYNTASGKRLVAAQLLGRWKLIRDEENDVELFFDLERDPSESEQASIAGNEEIHRRLTDALDRHMALLDGVEPTGAPTSEEDEMIREKLRDLGYVD